MDFSKIASKEAIVRAVEALAANGITAHVVADQETARTKALELIPEGAEVMQYTSVTLDTVGITEQINESGKYDAVRPVLYSLDSQTQKQEMNKLGAAPAYALGSVHAITEDGQVVIASNTGSQLPAYAYGAGKVIWVAGAQKIVKDLDTAMKRIYEYTLPLESARAHKAYGVDASNVSKLLIISKEVTPDRLHLIIIEENIGY